MRIIYIIALLFAFSSCKQDDFHKNEFRCSVNGIRFSASDYSRSGVLSKGSFSMATLDSSSTLRIEGWGKSDQGSECSLELSIKSFKGPGVYPVQRLKGKILINGNGQEQGLFSSDLYNLDSTVEASVHITHYEGAGSVAGYYHFLAKDPQSNKRVSISNGRFLLNVAFSFQ